MAGTSVGSREPSTADTGRANVSVNGASGQSTAARGGLGDDPRPATGNEPRDVSGRRERLPRPNRSRHRRRARGGGPGRDDAERHDVAGRAESAQPRVPDRDPGDRLGEADGHGGAALRLQQRRADVRRRRRDRHGSRDLVAHEPADPAGPPDVDGDGQPLARRKPLARPDVPCRNSTASGLPAGSVHRHVLDLSRRSPAARHLRARSPSRRRAPAGQASSAATAAPATMRTTPSSITIQTRIITISVCPTLRSEMARPEAGRGVARELSARRDRGVSARPADRAARLSRRRRDVRRPRHLRLRRRRGRHGHAGGPQGRDAAREPARLRRGRRVRHGRPRQLAQRDRLRHATKSSPATAIEAALALLRERFARTAGREAEPRPLSPGRRRPPDPPRRALRTGRRTVISLRKQGMRLCSESEKSLVWEWTSVQRRSITRIGGDDRSAAA